MKRRDFLMSLAAITPSLLTGCGTEQSPTTPAGAGAGASEPVESLLPTRVLGGSGESVSMLGTGGYHVGWTTEKDARETIEAALEGGVRFFDTAESYADGLSETRYGQYLVPNYRDEIYLMTKSTARTAEGAREHLEGSLTRMQTDYLDLWQIHSLQDPEDVDERLANGVLDAFLQAQEEGKVRHIGFTGHRDPAAHVRMLEKTRGQGVFTTCQMPVNVLDPSHLSFIENVIPHLLDQEIALLAMKTLADGRFFSVKERLGEIQWETDRPVVPDEIQLEEALNFVWSLPVSCLITGAENARLMREKIRLARSFERIPEEERAILIERVADLSREKEIEYFKKDAV